MLNSYPVFATAPAAAAVAASGTDDSLMCPSTNFASTMIHQGLPNVLMGRPNSVSATAGRVKDDTGTCVSMLLTHLQVGCGCCL